MHIILVGSVASKIRILNDASDMEAEAILLQEVLENACPVVMLNKEQAMEITDIMTTEGGVVDGV
jgi:hypothetical protein